MGICRRIDRRGMSLDNAVMRFSFVLSIVFVLACGSFAPAAPKDWQAVRVWVAGSEESVWVVGASPADEGALPVIQMWYADVRAKSAAPKQQPNLPAVAGEILEFGADARGLRVLYSNLTAGDFFGDRASMAGAVWRNQSDEPPLAWGGDSAEPVLYAVVETQTLKAEVPRPDTTKRLTTQPTTQPATQPTTQAISHPQAKPGTTTQHSATTEPAIVADGDGGVEAALPAGRLTCLRLFRGRWERIAGLQAAEAGTTFWVAGWKGDPFLFWQSPGGGVLFATHSPEGWSAPSRVLSEGDFQCGWAGAWTEGPLFIAGRGDADDAVQLHLYLLEGGRWVHHGAAREGGELLEINPRTSGVGIARGQLAVARPTKSGGVEFGSGEVGQSPAIDFEKLTLRTAAPEEMSPAQGLLVMALGIGLMMVVMYSRREQARRPAVVPAGFVLAPVWRRAVATIVDYLPAAILVSPFALFLMASEPAQFTLSTFFQNLNDPELRQRLFPAHVATILVYGVWCLVWELKTGSTPGKRLLGCGVLSMDGIRATGRQILWRNVMRVITFGMGEVGLVIALMMIGVITVNRQRLGDILAGTIVVMPGQASDIGPTK